MCKQEWCNRHKPGSSAHTVKVSSCALCHYCVCAHEDCGAYCRCHCCSCCCSGCCCPPCCRCGSGCGCRAFYCGDGCDRQNAWKSACHACSCSYSCPCPCSCCGLRYCCYCYSLTCYCYYCGCYCGCGPSVCVPCCACRGCACRLSNCSVCVVGMGRACGSLGAQLAQAHPAPATTSACDCTAIKRLCSKRTQEHVIMVHVLTSQHRMVACWGCLQRKPSKQRLKASQTSAAPCTLKRFILRPPYQRLHPTAPRKPHAVTAALNKSKSHSSRTPCGTDTYRISTVYFLGSRRYTCDRASKKPNTPPHAVMTACGMRQVRLSSRRVVRPRACSSLLG